MLILDYKFLKEEVKKVLTELCHLDKLPKNCSVTGEMSSTIFSLILDFKENVTSEFVCNIFIMEL